jgi:hypothetical protein
MIELTPDEARCHLLGMFDIDTAEHYGYYDELFALDFKKKEDAVYAIKKWLKPLIDERSVTRPFSPKREKEGLRRLITLNRLPASRHDMPGWGGIPMDAFDIHAKNFMLWLWETLYEEPFVEANLSEYRIRVDESFVQNPNNPERWGEPEYAVDEFTKPTTPQPVAVKEAAPQNAQGSWLHRLFR